LIVSNDTIMKPPYEITQKIVSLTASISWKLGEINAQVLVQPSPKLRKQNRIKTIHASLKIEGNTLTEEQITAIIENKPVIGPAKDVHEVKNAIDVYATINDFDAYSMDSFLVAHQQLMNGLIDDAGQFRKKGVGIMKGEIVEHIAPPAENVPFLIKDLFNYLQEENDLMLIKSCVFHYELEFIHPFLDGNGRMGRLWQSVLLMRDYPVFQFLPFETLIAQSQEAYYLALAQSDKLGQSTPFIEYMLEIIDDSLIGLMQTRGKTLTQEDRLHHFKSVFNNGNQFERKDYLFVFKSISTATASRDLQQGVALGLFNISGEKNKAVYIINAQPRC